MQAGQLRHRIKIQAPSRITSPKSGEALVTFSDVRSVWGSIRPLTAREQSNFARTELVATHEIVTRYTGEITGDCQLVYKGRTFRLLGPPLDPDERRRELKMTVSEQR